jgi:hypothetical protein
MSFLREGFSEAQTIINGDPRHLLLFPMLNKSPTEEYLLLSKRDLEDTFLTRQVPSWSTEEFGGNQTQI